MATKMCITTTAKASLGDTFDFVNYYLNVGISHIYLFFDDPKDRAIDVLSGYKKVTCFKCDSKHWKKLLSHNENSLHIEDRENGLCLEERQQLNANFGLSLARKAGYNWIAHVDTDELVYFKNGINVDLSKFSRDVDVLRLPSMEAVPEKINYQNNLREISLFKNLGMISKFYYSNKRILQKLIPYFKKNEGKLKVRTMYFNSNAAGKSIVSIKADIKNIGMHEPIANEGVELASRYPGNISLLHFECRSFEDWKKKWIKVCDNPSDTTGYEDGKFLFFDDFKIAYGKGDEKKIYNIYKEAYFIPAYKKNILLSLGLLKRVRLNKKLFSNSEHL